MFWFGYLFRMALYSFDFMGTYGHQHGLGSAWAQARLGSGPALVQAQLGTGLGLADVEKNRGPSLGLDLGRSLGLGLRDPRDNFR